MTVPQVTLTTIDAGLGVLPPTAGKALVICGPADAGTLNTPIAFGRPKGVTDLYSAGPLVEFAAYDLNQYGRPVICLRTAASTLGAYGTIDVTGVTGTSVASLDATTHPNDDYQAVIKIIAGGTRGVAGITYQYSLDGGRTYSPTTALATAVTIVIPGSGGVTVNIAAGTLVAGDVIRFTCKAPTFSAGDITTALTALKNSNLSWAGVLFAGVIDAAVFDAIETAFASMQTSGKFRYWIGNTRMPNDAESEAAYKTALDAIFAAKSTTIGNLYAGAAKTFSPVSGRSYRRPAALGAGCREAFVSDEIDIADVTLGPLPGVGIVDANGNPEQHDEFTNPGLDDSRYATLRTWDGRAGVFVTRPRILCPAGSDYTITPYRKVMNLYCETILFYLQERLSKPVLVNKTTGFILEREAREIEKGARARLAAVLKAKPFVSDLEFTVSRTDNLLSTKTMNCDGSILPLAYPEFINMQVGFVNPALQVQPV